MTEFNDLIMRALEHPELRAIRKQQFEEAAKSCNLVNEHDLHRGPDGLYSMENTRKLAALFVTGIVVAQVEQDILGE